MKKLIKIAVIAVPVLIIVVLLVILSSLNRIVKAGVETMGPKVTGTSVTLENVKISPFSGQGALGGLRVANPGGFNTPNAFELGEVSVSIDTGSLRSDTIVIREILIDAPEITFEGDLSGSNISAIRKNVEAFSASKPAAKEQEPTPEEPAKPGKKVQIDRFALKNGKVELAATLVKGQVVTVPLPDIELTDIGKDSGGATVADAVNQVFPAVYKAITDAVLSADELVKESIEAVEDAAKGVRDTAEKEASKIIKDVKGIFDR
jgi:uncharacterized protein involved in outer membrane biogenesis